MTEKLWLGSNPTVCDGCNRPLQKIFFDMKTRLGPWGMLCRACAFDGVGVGQIGTGFGQKYEKRPNGKWVKVLG